MASEARIRVIGNLGGDPETRYTKNGQMNVSMNVAVNRKLGEREVVNWYRVTVWGKLAESVDRLVQDRALAKGSQIAADGRYHYDTYTDNNGQPRESHDVNADSFLLLGSRDNAAQTQGRGGSSMPRDREPAAVGTPADMDDLPF